MYEHMADMFGGSPNAAHFRLYSRWAKGQWGMICTGNVQVCQDHLTLGRDMVLPTIISTETIQPFKRLADIIHGEPSASLSGHGDGAGAPRTLAIMQLNHPGRQSANIIGGRWPFVPPLAPSAVALGRNQSQKTISASSMFSKCLHKLFFQTPRPMTYAEIDSVVDAFIRGAKLAASSGFDGVELHAAHGCE